MDPQHYYQGTRSTNPVTQLYAQQQQQQRQHFQHYHLQQQQHQNHLQEQINTQNQQSHQSINRQQERASSQESSSRRADRRQPIIIQNFELLPPGQAHLKRRSLSTANLFLSSASLRRETEIFTNTKAVEKVQLYNNPDSTDQSTAAELSPNHPGRRDVQNTVTTSDNPSLLRHSSAWATPRDESRSLSNSSRSDSTREYLLSRIHEHSSNPQRENAYKTTNTPQHMTNSSSKAEHGLYSNVKPYPNPADSGAELNRAHSYPILPCARESQKKTKIKKQVTFADNVSIPWPYTLVRDGKMWNTGNGVEDFNRILYTESALNGIDINNNTDIYSLHSTYQNANIFRPMPTKAETHYSNAKESPKPYQSILKNSKKYTTNAHHRNGNNATPKNNANYQGYPSKALPETTEDTGSLDKVHVDQGICGDGKESDSLSTQSGVLSSQGLTVGQISLQLQNNPELKPLKTNSKENLENNNLAGRFVVNQTNSLSVHDNEHFKSEFTTDANRIHPAKSKCVGDSEAENKGCVKETRSLGEDVQKSSNCNPNDNDDGNLEESNLDRDDLKNPSIRQSRTHDGVESNGVASEEHQDKEKEAVVSQLIDRNPEVTAYTVPQLVDSIDLSDYFSNMSRPGSVSGKPPIPSAFRPGPNNARLFSKPDSSRTPSRASGAINDNSKARGNVNGQVNPSSASIMRLKFLKDEPITLPNQTDKSSETKTDNNQTLGKIEDFDNLAIKVAGKGLELYRHPSLVSFEDQSLSEGNKDLANVPVRPVKPFNGKPGEAYLATGSAKPKTPGDVNTDFLMQMYSPTGERRVSINSTQNSDDTDTVAAPNSGDSHGPYKNTVTNGNDTTQRPHSGVTAQRSRIASTVTTSDWNRGYTANGDTRRPRESRRDLQNRKLGVAREDTHAFTPRSRERQRRLLTANLIGYPLPDLDDGATLTPRAVVQARARSTSASASGMFRGRNLSAHERTLGAMESAFLPERQRSARSGARGQKEGVAYTMGRTQLNRRLEMFVLSTTRPNTAMERSRSNLS